jgi:ABC-type glucose/galactose transport system permease subunit
MEHVEASMDAGPVVHGSIGIGAMQTQYLQLAWTCVISIMWIIWKSKECVGSSYVQWLLLVESAWQDLGL